VTRSEFLLAVQDEFGDVQGRALMRDLVLGSLGGVTAEQALADGVSAKAVWGALCEAMDVPTVRRHGVGLGTPPRS
jgi:hypothetical protein